MMSGGEHSVSSDNIEQRVFRLMAAVTPPERAATPRHAMPSGKSSSPRPAQRVSIAECMHRDALDADTRGAVQRLAAVSDAERHRVRGLERAVQDNVTEARFQAALLLKGNASDLSFAVRKLQAALLTVKERSYSKQEVRDLVKQATVAAAAGRGLPAELARAHDAADVKPESLQLGVFAGDWDVDERGDDDERLTEVPDEVRKWMERTDSHLSTCERALQQHGDRLAVLERAQEQQQRQHAAAPGPAGSHGGVFFAGAGAAGLETAASGPSAVAASVATASASPALNYLSPPSYEQAVLSSPSRDQRVLHGPHRVAVPPLRCDGPPAPGDDRSLIERAGAPQQHCSDVALSSNSSSRSDLQASDDEAAGGEAPGGEAGADGTAEYAAPDRAVAPDAASLSADGDAAAADDAEAASSVARSRHAQSEVTLRASLGSNSSSARYLYPAVAAAPSAGATAPSRPSQPAKRRGTVQTMSLGLGQLDSPTSAVGGDGASAQSRGDGASAQSSARRMFMLGGSSSDRGRQQSGLHQSGLHQGASQGTSQHGTSQHGASPRSALEQQISVPVGVSGQSSRSDIHVVLPLGARPGDIDAAPDDASQVSSQVSESSLSRPGALFKPAARRSRASNQSDAHRPAHRAVARDGADGDAAGDAPRGQALDFFKSEVKRLGADLVQAQALAVAQAAKTAKLAGRVFILEQTVTAVVDRVGEGSKHEQRVTDDRLDAAESRIHSVAEQAVQLIASEHRRLLQLERDVSVLSDKLEHAVDDHAFLKAQLDRQHREHSVQIDEILNTLERHRILDAARHASGDDLMTLRAELRALRLLGSDRDADSRAAKAALSAELGRHRGMYREMLGEYTLVLNDAYGAIRAVHAEKEAWSPSRRRRDDDDDDTPPLTSGLDQISSSSESRGDGVHPTLGGQPGAQAAPKAKAQVRGTDAKSRLDHPLAIPLRSKGRCDQMAVATVADRVRDFGNDGCLPQRCFLWDCRIARCWRTCGCARRTFASKSRPT